MKDTDIKIPNEFFGQNLQKKVNITIKFYILEIVYNYGQNI